MATKTIYHQLLVIKVILILPVLSLAAIGFVCGCIAAPFISGFNIGHKLSRQWFMLADMEKE